MPDLSELLLPRLLGRRLPGLPPLPAEFVLPDYDGGSIANLPGQVAAWLGVSPFGGGGLHPEWVSALGGPVTRVVMVLVDALGYQRFRGLLAEPGSAWAWLQRARLIGAADFRVPLDHHGGAHQPVHRDGAGPARDAWLRNVA